MKKLLSSFLAATLLLFSAVSWAPVNPVGLDTTTGQQKVAAGSIPDSTGTFVQLEDSQQGLYNICFAQGADSSQIKITSCRSASALSAANPGYVRMRSSTAATYATFADTADVTIDLTGAHWGLDTQGDTALSVLRVIAINDSGVLKWGIAYYGNWYLIRNTQDNTTASSITLPENILVNSDVTTDNSPALDVGWFFANFTDSSNEWAVQAFHPNESGDGIIDPWRTTWTGFSAAPSSGSFIRWQDRQIICISLPSLTTGTSNATTMTMTAPTKVSNTIASIAGAQIQDNGAVATTPGRVATTGSSTTLTFSKDYASGAFTASSTKGASFTACYPMFKP
jgi:hypothetical protein